MSLLDSVKPRKVLLLHSDDPNSAYYCAYATQHEGDQCPYLKFNIDFNGNKDSQPFCQRYNDFLEVDKQNNFLSRCEKCENEKL